MMNVAGVDLSQLPADLPMPQDDGGAAHLQGVLIDGVVLPGTSGRAEHVMYPVFPLDRNGLDVVEWLAAQPGANQYPGVGE